MNDLLPIGRFSRMCRLSIKALRLYDDLGLLTPTWVDPASGYRYYRAAQARRGEAIRILRAVDMPLEEIRHVLVEDDPAFTAKRLAMHRERLAGRLADQERMLRFLERLIDRGGTIVGYDVTIQQATDQRVATLRIHTTLDRIGADVARGFATVVGALGAAGAEPVAAPFIVYPDVIDEQTAGSIELCVPVAPDVEIAHGGSAGGSERGEVSVEVIPGGTVAATTHRGPYDEISPAYHAVSGWIEKRGHRTVGAPREVYLNDPQSVLPEELLTRVEFPIDAPT